MQTGYISKQAHEEHIAVKDGEIEYLKSIIKDLTREVQKLSRSDK